MKYTFGTLGKIIAASFVVMVSLLFVASPGAAIFVPDPPPVGNPGNSTDSSNAQAICEGSGGTWSGGGCSTSGPTVVGTIANITNILLFITGAISVIMVIIGGIRYATSAGDQAGVTAAKNTILYAIIGLVVTFIAYAIVNFVIVQVFK